ncbi:MAG: nickel pincer cofactor biosynthesis protein LarC [Planctomycetaceae bacterium]|jgi:uncharacterized protein (TIGR00299 family) protein|nr:nickel pincer cofactor biosynthesis protein LarC [Planctomycetaceae bacterium]
MKIGYFDCHSGISGDMTLGALTDAGVPIELLDHAVRSLGVEGLFLEKEEVKRKGFRAAQVHVRRPHEHAHRHLHHITEMIDQGDLTPSARELAVKIFKNIAEAEAKVHGMAVDHVHFHEVGAADSIADIVGAAVGLDSLGLDAVYASEVPTGTGTVTIAHGVCRVPAPATAELLTGIPIAPSDVPFELTTPTGAAILKTVVQSFGTMPAMTIRKIGYGAGGRELNEQPNILRFLIGEVVETDGKTSPGEDIIWMVETNLDDVSGEIIGHCITKLWTAGSLDVYTVPIQMKKQRPGTLLAILCHEENLDAVERILFEETTTLGIRRWPAGRAILRRGETVVKTPWGNVTCKTAERPDGSTRVTPEFESAKQLAVQSGVPLMTVYNAVNKYNTVDKVE